MRRVLGYAAAAIVAVVASLAIATWLLVRDDVVRLRAAQAVAEPAPRNVANAILAREGPFLLQPTIGIPPLRSFRPNVRWCGPSPLAHRVLSARREQTLRWRVRAVVTGNVVSRLFTPDELFAIYLHQSGADALARKSFGKRASQLNAAEAARLAAMLTRSSGS